MNRLYLLVEGQTEEAFINELLAPHYASQGLYLTPIIIKTSPGHKGGVVSYAKVKPQIEMLCKQDARSYVSTLFDLYALPADFPGKALGGYPAKGSGQEKAEFLERALAKDISHRNFIPNLLVHEFEALLFVRVEAFAEWTDDDRVLNPLYTVSLATAPEDINDSPQTAPSKRILAAIPWYQKTLHGPLIACDIGLDSIRSACPHFAAWLEKIEQLL